MSAAMTSQLAWTRTSIPPTLTSRIEFPSPSRCGRAGARALSDTPRRVFVAGGFTGKRSGPREAQERADAADLAQPLVPGHEGDSGVGPNGAEGDLVGP